MGTLLYIAFHDRSNKLFGVRDKILAQCRAFGEYGYAVERIERCGAQSIVTGPDHTERIIRPRRAHVGSRYARSVLDKQHQMRDIEAYVRGKRYDVCYIRYDFSDPGFIRLLRALARVCGKILLELPTYPYDAENRGCIWSRVKLAVDAHYRKQLHHTVHAIVTFYDGYSQIFGMPTIVTPNGFDFSSMEPVRLPLPADALHVIAVSSMREWHGYERFIEGMHRYYAQGGRRELVLHLVGEGRECPKYRALAGAYGLEGRVIFEGALHGDALSAVYESCAIGIDSLARHRSGIDVLSSLKSREYGAKGLPMINACRIDVLDDDFAYLLRVPADESPIEMEAVFAFYDRCFAGGRSRQAVAGEIRSYVQARCGMKETLKAVVDAL